jgi:hypothetical protein
MSPNALQPATDLEPSLGAVLYPVSRILRFDPDCGQWATPVLAESCHHEQGRLSAGKARELADMTLWTFRQCTDSGFEEVCYERFLSRSL